MLNNHRMLETERKYRLLIPCHGHLYTRANQKHAQNLEADLVNFESLKSKKKVIGVDEGYTYLNFAKKKVELFKSFLRNSEFPKSASKFSTCFWFARPCI